MYGIIINGSVQPAPSVVTVNGFTYVNPTPETLIAAGYLPVQFTPCDIPNAKEVWTVENGYCVQSWATDDTEREPTFDEQIEARVLYLELMSGMFDEEV